MPFKFFLLSLLLISCAYAESKKTTAARLIDPAKLKVFAKAEIARHMLIGRWYGDTTTKDGSIQKWLMEKRNDGTFTAKFQIFGHKNEKTENIEVGLWGIVGDVYFTMTREFIEGEKVIPANVTSASLYDAYKVISLNPDTFKYRSLSSGTEFTVRRVSDTFNF